MTRWLLLALLLAGCALVTPFDRPPDRVTVEHGRLTAIWR